MIIKLLIVINKITQIIALLFLCQYFNVSNIPTVKEQFLEPRYPDSFAVRKVATHLMLINKQASPIEVRDLLRELGFVAYREDVDFLMATLAQDEPWTWHYRDGHRVYHMDYSEEQKTFCEWVGFSSN